MRDKAKGAEFSTQFVQPSHGKRKKEKKKKMEGISSKQWEKQHPNQKLENVQEKDEMEESAKIHDRVIFIDLFAYTITQLHIIFIESRQLLKLNSF